MTFLWFLGYLSHWGSFICNSYFDEYGCMKLFQCSIYQPRSGLIFISYQTIQELQLAFCPKLWDNMISFDILDSNNGWEKKMEYVLISNNGKA